MEEMYQEYKDVAEFRMIYIREAHAVDGDRPNRVSQQLGIKEHTDFDDRCETAQRLIDDESLTMPMLIDDMDNSTDLAYSAKPDRVFLIRSDGRIAVAADKGPRGFAPALRECELWLTEFSFSAKEPSLSKKVIAEADKKTAARTLEKEKAAKKKGAEKGSAKKDASGVEPAKEEKSAKDGTTRTGKSDKSGK